jgi:Ca-activated chloride channel family protein
MSIMLPKASRALAGGAAVALAAILVSAAFAQAAPKPSGVPPAKPSPPRTPPPPAAPAKPASPPLVIRANPDLDAPQETFADEFSVSWILVPVSVKNRKGHVKGLEREDFELRVDGAPVRFADFEARGEVPWSIVFLQDLSGSMEISGKLEKSKKAILSFLDQARPGDEFALASFAGGVTVVDVQFTENQRPLRETLAKWEAYGKTGLHDAVSLLPQITGDSRNTKRAVILITDGADNASRLPPAQAREVVRRAQLPVFVLGLESGDPYAVSAEGEKLARYADVLNLLSSSTGGRYVGVENLDDLAAACTSIAEELRWQYVLGFETASSGPSRFRPITVTVDKKGVEVTYRRGYRGTPPRP